MAAYETIRPGDASYDDARRVHNGMIDRRPALIARCRSSEEIASAILDARSAGLPIAVRGGGHSIAGRSIIDGGVMIDLSAMTTVLVDPRRRIALADGGARWREFNQATSAYDLATTGGVISTTGVAGLTLGGGLGWLMGTHGLSVDNLLRVELVTADGKILDVSEATEPDLFWALRGGGGTFGIASRLEFRVHPLAGVTGGLIAHPFAAAGELFRRLRDAMQEAPDELALMPLLVHAPDGSGTKLAAVAIGHAGDPATAAARLEPLQQFGSPILTQLGPMTYPALNTMLDDGFPAGALYYWKSSFAEDLTDEAIDVLVDQFAACPSPMSGIAIEHFHGAVTRVPVDATAVPHRAPGVNVLIAGLWTEPAASEENIAWTRNAYAAMAPFFVDRRYVNYLSGDDDVPRSAYGVNSERLARLRRRYDPDDVFRASTLVPVAA